MALENAVRDNAPPSRDRSDSPLSEQPSLTAQARQSLVSVFACSKGTFPGDPPAEVANARRYVPPRVDPDAESMRLIERAIASVHLGEKTGTAVVGTLVLLYLTRGRGKPQATSPAHASALERRIAEAFLARKRGLSISQTSSPEFAAEVNQTIAMLRRNAAEVGGTLGAGYFGSDAEAALHKLVTSVVCQSDPEQSQQAFDNAASKAVLPLAGIGTRIVSSARSAAAPATSRIIDVTPKPDPALALTSRGSDLPALASDRSLAPASRGLNPPALLTPREVQFLKRVVASAWTPGLEAAFRRVMALLQPAEVEPVLPPFSGMGMTPAETLRDDGLDALRVKWYGTALDRMQHIDEIMQRDLNGPSNELWIALGGPATVTDAATRAMALRKLQQFVDLFFPGSELLVGPATGNIQKAFSLFLSNPDLANAKLPANLLEFRAKHREIADAFTAAAPITKIADNGEKTSDTAIGAIEKRLAAKFYDRKPGPLERDVLRDIDNWTARDPWPYYRTPVEAMQWTAISAFETALALSGPSEPLTVLQMTMQILLGQEVELPGGTSTFDVKYLPTGVLRKTVKHLPAGLDWVLLGEHRYGGERFEHELHLQRHSIRNDYLSDQARFASSRRFPFRYLFPPMTADGNFSIDTNVILGRTVHDFTGPERLEAEEQIDNVVRALEAEFGDRFDPAADNFRFHPTSRRVVLIGWVDGALGRAIVENPGLQASETVATQGLDALGIHWLLKIGPDKKLLRLAESNEFWLALGGDAAVTDPYWRAIAVQQLGRMMIDPEYNLRHDLKSLLSAPVSARVKSGFGRALTVLSKEQLSQPAKVVALSTLQLLARPVVSPAGFHHQARR